MRKLTLAGLLLVLVIAMAGCGGADPSVVAKAFLEDLQQQKYEEAYKHMGGRMVVSQDKFIEFAKEEADEKGRITSFSLGTPEQNGSLFAIIPVTLVWEKDGEKVEEKFELPVVMYEGEWRVSKYDGEMKEN